ncbi:MAG TPA: 5-(carboxyamino)imidazole ribonucleotide mutase [Symbiobacteriaceae bacterium]|jgi:5-(carboxyamino)imidazole ribonucleotide mutase|nr:5-(carboxyamino)imidazole ribonucleotide mutase [Symbiobacteriaceae bacterium]
MALVGIICGSESDLPKMKEAAEVLEQFAVAYELVVASAHRAPTLVHEWSSTATERGLEVLIAGAGMAAALPGVVAASTHLPVIGVPLKGSSALEGTDALYSIVQMPPGVPVATVAIDGAKNAAYLAVSILGIKHEACRTKMKAHKEQMERKAREAYARSLGQA